MEPENDQEGLAGSGLEGGASAEGSGGSAGAGADAGEIKFDPSALGLKTQADVDALVKRAQDYERLVAIYNRKGQKRNREYSERETTLKKREEDLSAREAALKTGGNRNDLPYHKSIVDAYGRLGLALPKPDEIGEDTRVMFALITELADKAGGIDNLSKSFQEFQQGYQANTEQGSVSAEEAKFKSWEREFYVRNPKVAELAKSPRAQKVAYRMAMEELGERPDFDDMTDEEVRNSLHAILLEHYVTLGYKPPQPPAQLGGGAGGAGRGKTQVSEDWSTPEGKEAILAAARRDAERAAGGP